MQPHKPGLVPFWGWLVGLYVCGMLLLGGTSQPHPSVFIVQLIWSGVLFLAALIHMRFRIESKAGVWGAIVALLALLVVGLQLVPLPADIWTKLPGRQFLIADFEAAKLPLPWLALSLDPSQTLATAVTLTMPIAAYLATLRLSRRDLFGIFLALSIIAVGCVILALAQKLSGPESALHFYGYTSSGLATSTFTNRNFFAAQLYLAIPIIAVVATETYLRTGTAGWLMAVSASVYLVIIVAGLAIVESRAGLILAMVSLLLTVVLLAQPSQTEGRRPPKRWIFLVVLAFVVVVGQVSLAGLMRLTNTDPLSDLRPMIQSQSLDIAMTYFPAGTGFGTFVPVYQMHERPEIVLDAFVNHAHNDWIELLFEGGLPAILVLSAGLLWVIIRTYKVWFGYLRSPVQSFQAAAGIAVLLYAIHSLVDYPLRTPAHLTLLGFFLGLLAIRVEQKNDQPKKGSPPLARPLGHRKPVPFQSTRPGRQNVPRTVQ